MSSFTLKLSSFLVSSPSQSSSYSATTSYLPPLPLFRFPRTRFNSRGRVAVVGAAESDKTNYPISGDSKTPNGTLPKTRRVILLEYVQNVQPEFMELFVKRAPQQVVEPMRQTVTNMNGTLPPQFFSVTVTTKFSVPQKYFCHFYIVGVIWTAFLLVATWLYAYETAAVVLESSLYPSIASQLAGVSQEFSLKKVGEYKYGVWNSVFLLLLMEAQVLRRLVESVYVFKYSPSARMHIAGYLTGLFFYTAAPLSLCCTYSMEVFTFVAKLLAEFIVKGKERMQVAEFNFLGDLSPFLQLKWYSWIGATFFFSGWIHQRRCHSILGSIRKNGHKSDEYAIPEGDWFEYVSSPHYLAELVIYGGLVIASGFCDITIWLVFGFVVAILTLAAGETHRWYLCKFDNYPRNRYAIVPFIH